MRTCSQCRRSFPDGTRKCPHCDTYLLALWNEDESDVDEPEFPVSERDRQQSEGLVVVARCRTRWEADFVRTLLESEGIATGQKPSAATEAWGYLPSFSATIEILVRAEDEEEARNILLSGRDDAPGEQRDS